VEAVGVVVVGLEALIVVLVVAAVVIETSVLLKDLHE